MEMGGESKKDGVNKRWRGAKGEKGGEERRERREKRKCREETKIDGRYLNCTKWKGAHFSPVDIAVVSSLFFA